MAKIGLVWLRRNLRLEDNYVIMNALQNCDKVVLAFVFDANILKNFPNAKDRRLSFIANALEHIDLRLKQYASNLLVLHGDPAEQITEAAKRIKADYVYADQDFEPSSLDRDNLVKEKLRYNKIEFVTILDHLIFPHNKILNASRQPYKVYTPYMKAFRSIFSHEDYKEYNYELKGRLLEYKGEHFDKKEILRKSGYEYIEDKIWHPKKADSVLAEFVRNNLKNYHDSRNNLYQNGTSQISPYLRFGIISIRKCFRIALDIETNPAWVNELIWREFYSYILFHFPETENLEFQTKYRNKIEWSKDDRYFEGFINGRTGFPLIDAAVNELILTGWMHNRARMIVASFFTKNLFLDWRLGEKFFSEYLMDYDLASNIGGWQWAASVGTDAQPYFRIFNPISQTVKFDPEGIYIKKYLPILKDVDIQHISDGDLIAKNYKIYYPSPIIDYKSSRAKAISYFSSIK